MSGLYNGATPESFPLQIVDTGEGFHAPMSPYRGMGLKIISDRGGKVDVTGEIAPDEPRGTGVRLTGEHPATAALLTGAHHVRREA